MESYTPLSQGDDETDKSSLYEAQEKIKANRSHSPYIWFATGFGAALIAAVVFAFSYRALNSVKVPPGLIPNFPTVEVEFKPHPEFSNITDADSTRLWYDMQDASRYSMEPGIPVTTHGHGERLIVSGLHGLHCLRTIRNELTFALLGHSVKTTTKHKAHNHPGRPDHCFDYLRQLLMCNLDLTYETSRVDLDGKRRVADGWGMVHQCKDWSAINAWMLENWKKEMSLDDWIEPDPNKPAGQDELYGDIYPLYDEIRKGQCS